MKSRVLYPIVILICLSTLISCGGESSSNIDEAEIQCSEDSRTVINGEDVCESDDAS